MKLEWDRVGLEERAPAPGSLGKGGGLDEKSGGQRLAAGSLRP